MIARPYQNSGNPLVLSLVPEGIRHVLDVGCGAGDNARRLKQANPEVEIVGLTHNELEAAIARDVMSNVHVMDVEYEDPLVIGKKFDLLIFSHVLEHLRDPVAVLRRFLPLLTRNGHVLIAVPNTLELRTRLAFLRGRFHYTDHGILDRTHLRFFTYNSAESELISPIEELTVVKRKGRGAAPLGPLRRWLLTVHMASRLDTTIAERLPNLFAREIAILARKNG